MLGCWVTVLQCCTGSLSWLLDTRPCPSVPATPTCQMSLLCAHLQPAPTRAVLCTSHPGYWLFMFAAVFPNISVSSHPRHLVWVEDTWRSQCLSVLEEEDPGSSLRPPLCLQSPASPPRHPTPSCQDSRHSHSQPSLKDARLWQIKPI